VRRAWRLSRTADVVAAVLVVPVLDVVVVVAVAPVVVVVPVVGVVPWYPGSPGPVHAHATPPPPASVRTLVATATAFRCFLVIEASFGLVPCRSGPSPRPHGLNVRSL
jgi:hypothetical protein